MFVNDHLKDELRANNVTVQVKGCKLREGYGHEYIISVKKKAFLNALGSNREYLIFRSYREIKQLCEEMVKQGGMHPRRFIPMLGPNPYDASLLEPSDHMSLRLELTLKQITDVLSTIIEDAGLRNMTIFNHFLKPDPKASRKII